MKTIIAIALFGLVSLNTQAQNNTPGFIKDSLEKYIQQGLKDFNIPGLAIAVVKDGKTIVMKGFGTKAFNNNEPVDENTHFIIASNSKLFTGTAISMLHQNKMLSLDDKVTKYLPYFSLYDKQATNFVTVKDLLCHRLGTKTFQGDFTFWNSNLPSKEIITKMRYMPPSMQFRTEYGYCNSAFLAAGEIIPVVTKGKHSWFSFVQDSILNRVGMSNTYMYTAQLPKSPNHALPHSDQFGDINILPYDKIDNLGPATSMVSCVKDIAKWLQLQLDSGKVAGKQVIPWQVLQRTRDVNIITGSRKSSVYPVHFRGYGLGVFTADYAGHQVYWHTGGAFGYVTNTCFVPEANLGITILTNNDNQSFFEALRYQILDAYLNVPYVNRAAPMLNDKQAGEAATRKDLTSLDSAIAAQKNNPVYFNSLAGVYKHELYGNITISVKNNKAIVQFQHHPDLKATLSFAGGNNFVLEYNNKAYGIFLIPVTVVNNKVKSIAIKANDFVEYDAYEFKKIK
jgi:CubicO group peptidase (beta-lactamase class C family)